MTDIFSDTALQTRSAAAATAQAVWPWDDRDRKRAPHQAVTGNGCRA